MKAFFHSYTPMRIPQGVTYSFTILPEISFFWCGGLDMIYISWLFFEINIHVKD